MYFYFSILSFVLRFKSGLMKNMADEESAYLRQFFFLS